MFLYRERLDGLLVLVLRPKYTQQVFQLLNRNDFCASGLVSLKRPPRGDAKMAVKWQDLLREHDYMFTGCLVLMGFVFLAVWKTKQPV